MSSGPEKQEGQGAQRKQARRPKGTRQVNDVERKAEAVRIAKELTEVCGEDTASYWVWEETPMPCGLPDDEQLAVGQRMIERGRAAARKEQEK